MHHAQPAGPSARLGCCIKRVTWLLTQSPICCRRLPGCPNLAAGLLQAAVQSPGDDPHNSASQHLQDIGGWGSQSFSEQQGMQQARQRGIAVTTDQDKLVLNDLMRRIPLSESAHVSLEECGDHRAWADALGTEWVTHCTQVDQANHAQQHTHRLYVQASPGEMRLATVMFAGA